MWNNIREKWLTPVIVTCFIVVIMIGTFQTYGPKAILSTKDVVVKQDIQNHLLWSIKGECFFVAAGEQGYVKLVPVEDCNKK